MAEGVKTKTIIKLLFFISINGKKLTVMIEHNKLAFDQRDKRLVKRST